MNLVASENRENYNEIYSTFIQETSAGACSPFVPPVHMTPLPLFASPPGLKRCFNFRCRLYPSLLHALYLNVHPFSEHTNSLTSCPPCPVVF